MEKSFEDPKRKMTELTAHLQEPIDTHKFREPITNQAMLLALSRGANPDDRRTHVTERNISFLKKAYGV